MILAFLAVTALIAADESISVKVVGKLRTGIVAIGGETTGTTITAKGVTWELDFGKNAELRKAAEKLDGKEVTVRGMLERRAGVEIKERWIVTVTELKAVEGDASGALQRPGLQATVGRTETRIRFLSEGDTSIFDITSATGIDKATIKRESDEWPKSILVRLHLGGLESFKAGGKGFAIEWSVSSTGEHEARSTLVSGKRVADIKKDSPFYGEVRIGGGGKKIPLKDGYFEVPLPAKLFEQNPETISLEWVDFYRN